MSVFNVSEKAPVQQMTFIMRSKQSEDDFKAQILPMKMISGTLEVDNESLATEGNTIFLLKRIASRTKFRIILPSKA